MVSPRCGKVSNKLCVEYSIMIMLADIVDNGEEDTLLAYQVRHGRRGSYLKMTTIRGFGNIMLTTGCTLGATKGEKESVE